jgi:peptidyl-prolyl cis-trans isomerase C
VNFGLAPTAAAATVNGQPVLESAVLRGLRRVPPQRHVEARPEILNYLIENALIDQYLLQLRNFEPKPEEVAKRIADMKAEIAKEKKDYAAVLKDMDLTEAELKQHITADLRWDKYAEAQATDKVLRELFTANKDMFDGSMVRVRHILLTPDAKDAKKVAAARAELVALKQKIEADVAKKPAADPLARNKALEDAFAAAAKEKSACPSKLQGGDVGWFDRAGVMVEPFAKAAFALKPYQMSDVVETQFGLHLLLLLDRRPGKEVKYEDARADVKEVYCDRLRDSLVAQLRQRATITITPVK